MTRVVTGLLLAIVACFLILFSPPLIFRIAALAVAARCYREYSGLVAAHDIKRPGYAGLLAGIAFLYLSSPVAVVSLSLLLIAAFSLALLRWDEMSEVLPQVSGEFLGTIYCFLPWHFADLLRTRSVHWLFFALALNWFGDSVAYYVGQSFGKHRLAPTISPKKSWEGAIGAIAGSVVFGLIYMGYFQPRVAAWKVIVIAIIANIAGQLGDLSESAIKRGAGVKDSGTLLPGHGGLLDRVDSSLFAVPVVYALSLLIH